MSAFDEQLATARELRTQGRRGRYAPSPTGPLHLGNVRTALISWLQARLVDGTYIMRNEDLDENRAVEGCDEQIYEDLRWLGLDWDEGPDVGGPVGPYDQSERTAFYQDALLTTRRGRTCLSLLLLAKGCARGGERTARLERCDLSGHVPRLDSRAGRRASPAPPESHAVVAISRDHGRILDGRRVAGPYSQNLEQDVGDFVIRRADELYAYQLAVVVDDALMGMTDVVRGDDLAFVDAAPDRALSRTRTPGAQILAHPADV